MKDERKSSGDLPWPHFHTPSHLLYVSSVNEEAGQALGLLPVAPAGAQKQTPGRASLR